MRIEWMTLPVALVAATTLSGCFGSSGAGGAGGQNGVTSLTHRSSDCIFLNGRYENKKNATSTEWLEFRTSKIANGVELVNVGPTEAESIKFIYDDQIHDIPSSQGNASDEKYRGACETNALKLDILIDAKLVARLEYVLNGKRLTSNVVIIDGSKLPPDNKPSSTVYENVPTHEPPLRP